MFCFISLIINIINIISVISKDVLIFSLEVYLPFPPFPLVLVGGWELMESIRPRA